MKKIKKLITRPPITRVSRAMIGRSVSGKMIIDPLPAGSYIVELGDSVDEFNFNAGANQAARATGLIMNAGSGGEVFVAQCMDPTRFYYDAYNDVTDSTFLLTNTARYYGGGNVGRAGAGSADIIAEVPRAAAYAAGLTPLVILGGGTNYQNLSDPAFLAAKLAEIDAVRASFPRSPILVTGIRPVAFSQAGTRPAAATIARNVQMQAACAQRPGCFYVDMSGYADDGVNSGYSLDRNFQVNPDQASPGGDGLHPGPVGATKYGGPAILAAIQAHVQSSGTNLILGRKIASFMPAGMATNTGSQAVSHTAGTGGGIISGNIPLLTDFAHGTAANVSDCACSLEANPETGVQNLVLTFNPKGANTKENFVYRPSAITINGSGLQNQWVVGYVDIEVDQGAGHFQLNINSAERSNVANNNAQVQFLGLFPRGSGFRRFYVPTPPLKFVAGSTGIQPSVTISINPTKGAGPYVAKIRYWDFFTVPSPIRP